MQEVDEVRHPGIDPAIVYWRPDVRGAREVEVGDTIQYYANDEYQDSGKVVEILNEIAVSVKWDNFHRNTSVPIEVLIWSSDKKAYGACSYHSTAEQIEERIRKKRVLSK